jgi:hypothetical protein
MRFELGYIYRVMAQTLPEGEFLLPLFPLPGVVFFPKTRLPLNVFEPRYRQMVSDVLRGGQRIGMVLLKPGWEADYYGAPPVFEYGTAGFVEQALLLKDGRYEMVLGGIGRFRILGEVSSEPYRVVRAVAAPEDLPSVETGAHLRALLVALAQQYVSRMAETSAVPELAGADIESLTNALIMALSFESEDKQRLLELPGLLDRAQSVAAILTERLQTIAILAPYRKAGDPSWN